MSETTQQAHFPLFEEEKQRPAYFEPLVYGLNSVVNWTIDLTRGNVEEQLNEIAFLQAQLACMKLNPVK